MENHYPHHHQQNSSWSGYTYLLFNFKNLIINKQMKSKYADRKKIYYIDFIEYYVDNKLIINQFREIKKNYF